LSEIRITAAAAADRALYVAAAATALKFHPKYENRENRRQNETHYGESPTSGLIPVTSLPVK
jgi:translation initiation factor 2B subunit (eIF-2B alpha/beta/delta family)